MRPNCIATRGDHCLIDDGNGRGHVETLTGERLGRPTETLPIQSILARGYWGPVKPAGDGEKPVPKE